MKGVILKHNKGQIQTGDDKELSLTTLGGIKTGDGTNINPVGNEGVLVFNVLKGKMEISTGTRWLPFDKKSPSINNIVGAIIFE